MRKQSIALPTLALIVFVAVIAWAMMHGIRVSYPLLTPWPVPN